MLVKLKGVIEHMPEPVGSFVARVPYGLRLGPQYGRSRRDIVRYSTMDPMARESFILQRVRRIVEHAVATNEFYRSFYADHGFDPEQLREFADIKRIPILRKEDLRSWDLDRRSATKRGRFKINTGGTSGQPLELYSTRDVFANEWAHMHHIWARLGYRQTDLKLTLRGKNLGSRALRYNPVHNELVVSAYQPLETVTKELSSLLRHRTVRYIHGYPSTVYEFASHCLSAAPELLAQLRRTVAGVLLGSEYPAPRYYEVIQKAFEAPVISWYGHSEMAVLAYEVNRSLEYVPLQTYGYAEAISKEDGTCRLVATSYYNEASHFIRFDTGDDIVPVRGTQVLESFRMASGRTGEFIVDGNGRRLSLTALIFGRHHEAFGLAKFIQVRQEAPGKATILVVPQSHTEQLPADWHRHFDFKDVAVEFAVEVIDKPIRTAAGKTPLLVRSHV